MPWAPERGRRAPSTENKRRDNRPSAARRGYGRRWQKYAAAFKAANPLCRHCLERGRVSATEAVDHITPVDGPNDPLFWVPSNHQPLCWSCHSRKTNLDQCS